MIAKHIVLKLTSALLITAVALSMVAVIAPSVAQAGSSKQAACEAVGGTYSGGQCSTGRDDPTVQDAVRAAVNILSIIVGIAAVIMIMIGGFRYITSNGDANSISSAKNTIMYALIGLVIVALAQAIVWFVLSSV